jgi:hypothetical protein
MTTTDDSGGGKATKITDAASSVADTTTEKASELLDVGRDEIRGVRDEAAVQIHQVMADATSQAKSRLDSEMSGAIVQIRHLADQGQALAEGRPKEAGDLRRYAETGVAQMRTFADRMERAGPDGLLRDVQTFARRRPALFLALAASGGFVLGRMIRSGALSHGDPEGTSPDSQTSPYADDSQLASTPAALRSTEGVPVPSTAEMPTVAPSPSGSTSNPDEFRLTDQ